MKESLITLEALEILDAIERRGSFSKAAEDLNKATSALSYGIQKIEEKLDISLFQREGRRSVLTPAGRVLLEEGRKILNSSKLLTEKAKRVATGWEPRLSIAIESIFNHPLFFQVLAEFMQDHEKLEIDISSCVLSGGWEALGNDRVDLVIGVPGPIPLQKGFRALPIKCCDLTPVISSQHPLANLAEDPEALKNALPKLRRIVMHDTSVFSTVQNMGLSNGKQILYVQTIDQKIEAILSGLGIGHVPKYRIQCYLESGRLKKLNLDNSAPESYIAWKTCNKGKALKSFIELLTSKEW